MPDAHGLVANMLAMQAQDRPAALWATGLRTGATVAEVESAVASGGIVRTWLMRGTLHFTAPDHVRWLLDLLAPRIIAQSRRRDEQLGLDDDAYERSGTAISGALEERGTLSRSSAMNELERAGVSTTGQRGYHILRRLALEKLICFGPMLGREPSFMLLDEVVPQAPRADREEALRELTRRYFMGHGPAGLRDLAWWSGITMSEARRAVEAVGEELAREGANGSVYWSAPAGIPKEGGPRAHLLPAFDEYVIGYQDRGDLLDAGHTKDVLSSNGIFYPTVVIDGRVRGTWRAKRTRGGMAIEVTPFSPLTSELKQMVEEAGARYSRFIGLPVALTIKLAGDRRPRGDGSS